MALANFFDKTALAASQILQGYNKEEFEKKLEALNIEIAFDSDAISSPEGTYTLDLIIRLLSRFYPKLYINALESGCKNHAAKLEELAKSINPLIAITTETPFSTIVVGNKVVSREGLVFYTGSNEWIVSFSQNKPVGSGKSANPFGAGAAACFAVANVFRAVFNSQLDNANTDNDFTLSLLNFEANNTEENVSLANVSLKLEEVFLVGLGAIGNGALWALSKLSIEEGVIHIIDPEQLEPSNLQRYVLATQEDVGFDKVRLCDRYGASGVFKPLKGNWSDFLSYRQNWNLPLVALAVDSAEDRILAQSSLPRVIINAWTQPSDLGVSRHYDFLKQPCVACIYPTKEGLPSKSQTIADALGLPEKEILLRELIYNNSPLDETWIKEIANAKGRAFEELKEYIGMPISIFYSKVLCGGIVTTTNHNQQMETPMAFQSALAGILLASEIVIYSCGLRKEIKETMTRINLLIPLAEYLNEPLAKTLNSSCICNDTDFKNVYTNKYQKSIA